MIVNCALLQGVVKAKDSAEKSRGEGDGAGLWAKHSNCGVGRDRGCYSP